MELTHALFRVARGVRHEGLKSRIEAWGITFLESTSLCHLESIAKDIHILEQLIIFGETVGEIPYQNSRVLYAQFEAAKLAIRQHEEVVTANSAIDHVFSGEASSESYRDSLPISIKRSNVDKEEPALGEQDLAPSINKSPFIIGLNNNEYHVVTASSERRKVIVEKIRQLGSAAMKDLIAAFPSVSERTIRYDLQKLCELMVLERSGNGGPASYYHVRDGVVAREPSLA